MFLHGNIGQVHVHVVQFRDARVVFDRAKAAKTVPELVRFQRPERRHEHVEPQIELFAANQ